MIKMTLQISKDDTGSALVTVLIIISLISIITMGIMGATALQQRFIKRDLNRMQAFYLAEAGIQKTLWLLNRENGQNWRVTNFQIPLFDGLKADISLMDWGAFLLVQSRANYKKQTAKIETIIGEKMPAAFQQAVIIGGTEYPLVVIGNNNFSRMANELQFEMTQEIENMRGKYIPAIKEALARSDWHKAKAEELGIVLKFPEKFFIKQSESIEKFKRTGEY